MLKPGINLLGFFFFFLWKNSLPLFKCIGYFCYIDQEWFFSEIARHVLMTAFYYTGWDGNVESSVNMKRPLAEDVSVIEIDFYYD